MKNIVLGLGVSSVIGLVSGIVPAAMAARLDPVMRSAPESVKVDLATQTLRPNL